MEKESKEELARLIKAWRRLTWWQKKRIVIPLQIERTLDACATAPWYWLQTHIDRRRAQYAYIYPAHWL